MDYKDDWKALISEKFSEIPPSEAIQFMQVLLGQLESAAVIVIPMEANKYKLIAIDDILYIKELTKGNLVIATLEYSYPYGNEAFDIFQFLQTVHSNFVLISNKLIVNTKRVSSYDSYFRKIFFGEEQAIEATGAAIRLISKHCEAAKYDLNQSNLKIAGEYSPKFNKHLK